MRHPASTTSLALALLVVLSACATTMGEDAAPEEPQQETMIQVENYHQLPVTAHVVSTGQDYRLGQVSAGQTETFELPRQVNELDVQIVLEPLGSLESYRSRTVAYSPGDLIVVDIQGNLGLTDVTVQ